MAESLDDGEFWLPPQFLVDDDEDDVVSPNDAPKDSLLFPSEFPYGFDSSGVPSDLSSPVESVVGSSETESDEEEGMADLTRRMAHSTLELDFPKEMFGSGSPQSTLCAVGSGCGCRKSSSEGSPNSTCQLSSQKATWDLLHAAAGEVEKIKLNKEANNGFNNNNRSFLSYNPVSLSANDSDPSDGVLYTNRSLTHQQIHALQLQILKQQQMAKLRYPSFGFYQQRRSNQIAPISGPRNAWPPIQQAKFQPQFPQTQQLGSGMRAVFLENPSGKKRESAGTGVFLPRRVDNPSHQSKKKPACSTALVPARVAQALNLNLENMMGGHPQPQDQHRFNVVPNMDNEAAFPKLRRIQGLSQHQQKRSFQPLPPSPSPSQPPQNSELRLPQEWTY